MINTIIIGAKKHDREQIASVLSCERDITVLAQGKDGYDALKLAGRHKPDIFILDNLGYLEMEEIPHLLRIRSPSAAVVFIIAKISDYQLYRAAMNEVSGFVSKETDMNMLPGILKFISNGRSFISPALASRILHLVCSNSSRGAFVPGAAVNKYLIKTTESNSVHLVPGRNPADYLSKTELRILVEIGEGHASGEIARNTGLAVGTVRNYISSIMHKMGLNNRTQMARYAFSCGLVPMGSSCYIHGKLR